MFGYVTTYKAELKVKDYETYKAVYCSLCKQLGKDYSVFTRFLLNYDCTFLTLFAMANQTECPTFKKGRCRFNPCKACNYCKGSTSALSRSAALIVLMSYYKLIDNIRDGSFFKKIGFTILRPIFALWKNKAKKKYPEYFKACEKMYTEQIKAEEGNAGIDESAEPTAKLLEFVFSQLAYSDKIRPAFEQFGYHLGKWIYLMDAACDIDEDIKHKSFNPIYNKLGASRSESAEFADALLSHSVYLLTSAYALIDKKRFADILDNIVLLGLTKKQKELLRIGKEIPNE
ncbi:MAG: hypothetical protein IKB72_02170 [Ruminococcus sp.]|nr:hypothetical protein [Ruminococcus sp.]